MVLLMGMGMRRSAEGGVRIGGVGWMGGEMWCLSTEVHLWLRRCLYPPLCYLLMVRMQRGMYNNTLPAAIAAACMFAPEA